MNNRYLTRKLPTFIFLALSAIVLGGCSASLEKFSGNTAFPLSESSSLSINQKIDIKPGRTRVFIQDGIIVSRFNHYAPNCNIEVRKKDEDNWQSIQPDTYRVQSTQLTLEQVVMFKPGIKTRLAGPLRIAEVDSGQTDIYLGMHFYLSGEDDNVMRLSCRGSMAQPHEARYPTLAEIHKVLGNIMTLAL